MILAKKNRWKTETRRPIKPQPEGVERSEVPQPYYNSPDVVANKVIKCPYGTNGDRLWTRETYSVLDCSDFEQALHVEYQADGHTRWIQLSDAEWEKYRAWKEPFGTKPNIFMFKSLCRFWDEVTEIQVERIQAISEKGACKEGVKLDFNTTKNHSGEINRVVHHYWDYQKDSWEHALNMDYAARNSFKTLWQSMYQGGPFDWDNNPYVWVVKYKPLIVNGTPENQKALAI